MKIGNVKIKNCFFLAPMASFSTAPFRRLCREEGAGLTTSEMVSSEAVLHKNAKTESIIARARGERPYAIQVFGSEPGRIALAAAALEKKCEIIDVNLGCPVRHVMKQGAGAALLKDPAKIAEIFDAMSVLKIPYTAKMRLGFDTNARALEIARIVEKGGASLLTVHGRTGKQDYSVPPDLASIRKIKHALSIPVIGNGGISRPEDAESMIEKTGCDGVMVGRAAIGNPFIFRQMNDYFSKGSYLTPTTKDCFDVLGRFLRYSKNEPISVVRFQAVQFILGIENAAKIRKKIAGATSLSDITGAMESFGGELDASAKEDDSDPP
jgi:tRNA-dihydrouridine synthase B